MRATGWNCDACNQFVTSPDEKHPPVGWMVITPILDPTIRASSADVFHVCSNVCLKKLGDVRVKAERELATVEVEPKPPPTSTNNGQATAVRQTAKESQRLRELRLQHINEKHKNFVNPECDLCELETRG